MTNLVSELKNLGFDQIEVTEEIGTTVRFSKTGGAIWEVNSFAVVGNDIWFSRGHNFNKFKFSSEVEAIDFVKDWQSDFEILRRRNAGLPFAETVLEFIDILEKLGIQPDLNQVIYDIYSESTFLFKKLGQEWSFINGEIRVEDLSAKRNEIFYCVPKIRREDMMSRINPRLS